MDGLVARTAKTSILAAKQATIVWDYCFGISDEHLAAVLLIRERLADASFGTTMEESY